MSLALTVQQVAELPDLPLRASDLEYGVRSSPFSEGQQNIQRYRKADLRAKQKTRTGRVEFFERKLVWLHRKFGHPVPYAFRLRNRQIRSLDAGCLGFLARQSPAELRFVTDSQGFILAVEPTQVLRRRHQPGPKVVGEFTMPDLLNRGRAPAMAFLIGAVEQGLMRVTYKEVADALNTALGLSNVTHHHVGPVIDMMMREVQQLEPDAPLLNLMVTRTDGKQPGKGADPFLKSRYRVSRLTWQARKKLVTRALNEIKSYSDWVELYRRIHGRPLVRSKLSEQFDNDGQGDNPRLWKRLGALESQEHKNLKEFVRRYPERLGLDLQRPTARIERPLVSGDRLDVEIIDGLRWIAIEVKSIRSGNEDLRRGLYQCVKYKAVMEAQSSFIGDTKCDALLVIERPLPSTLLREADHLGVRHVVLSVNSSGRDE